VCIYVGGVVMRKFLRIILVNEDVVLFPIEEVVDVVGCRDTLEVQVVRSCGDNVMPYKVEVLGEGDEKYDHWRSVLNNIERQLTA